MLETVNGRIAVGWLVVEDLVTVLVLVLLPPLAAWPSAAYAPRVVGDRSSADNPRAHARPGRGLYRAHAGCRPARFPMAALAGGAAPARASCLPCASIAAAVGIAYGSAAFFGVSFALGAFFAGMVMRESPLSYRAAEESLPSTEMLSRCCFLFRWACSSTRKC